MRNSFVYYGFSKRRLLKSLLNISKSIDYISMLISNFENSHSDLPKDYINYDLLAGVGKQDSLISNNQSFEKLKDFHAQKKDWLFGYLAYDLKNEVEELSSNNTDNFNADNLLFFVPEYILLLKDGQLEIQTHHSKESCDKFVSGFDFSDLLNDNVSVKLFSRDNRTSYYRKIEKIKNHIKRGDIYEMNYCQEFYADDIEIVPESIFLELIDRMQTPFSSFLKLNDKYILSASPERFLRKKATNILSQPIKGTRKRGVSKFEDDNLINELKASQKDMSENVMITDLTRNDLSITAKKGSVNVEELCRVYTFKQVHQMITSISSIIHTETNFLDVLKSTFPMGSMTGAPKLRAMELIDSYEEKNRNFYSGSLGYIDPNGDFDFNVIIRTIVYNAVKKYLSVGVGGAITTKSEPELEYKECLIKIKPIIKTLNCD